MFARVCFGLLSLTAVRLSAQVVPDASGGSPSPDDEYQMSMPTQVSGRSYPMEVGPEQRTNDLSLGLIFTVAYDDNLYAGGVSTPVSATSFALFPTIGFHRSTPREDTSINYGVGFTYYHPNPTNSLNNANQNLNSAFAFRLTKHSSLSIQDTFQQNSTQFNQPYPLNGTAVSGSTIGPSTPLIVPYENQIFNSTRMEYGYQFSRNAMFGGAGTYGIARYPDLTATANLTTSTGLNNSDSAGGLGFYTRRLSKTQFLGVIYQYSHTTTNPVDSTTNTQAGSLFYTVAPSSRFTLSVTAGPQYFTSQVVGFPKTNSIGSFVLASFDVHGPRSSVAASYSHSVTAGQGLLGAFTSDGFNVSARRQLSRLWSAGISGSYYDLTNATSVTVINPATRGGHGLFGTVMVSRQLGEHLTAEADYRRLHQTYGGIPVISNSPDDDRVSVSINYQYRRPIGR